MTKRLKPKKIKELTDGNITVKKEDGQLKIILNDVHYTLNEEHGMLSILKVNKRDTGFSEFLIKPIVSNKILIY